MNKFLVLIPAGFVVVLAAKCFQRWRTFGTRTAKALRDTYDAEKLRGVIEFEEFREVMELIAQCYRVPVEKLRIEDSFKTELGQVDSFSLDYGVESTTRRLTEKFSGINLEKVRTVRDILIAVAGESKKRAES